MGGRSQEDDIDIAVEDFFVTVKADEAVVVIDLELVGVARP
jgi:hypothetical protein